MPGAPYYATDLALVHHLGFGAHAEGVAPGIVELLRPIRERGGLVVELGCGSGLLTKRLVDTGHRVLATDASPAMIELAREHALGAEIRTLVLPDDPIPEADAVVAVGHPLNYLRDENALFRALAAAARALRPGGLLALDVCDLEWAIARRDAPPFVKVERDWVIVTRFSIPASNHFVRDITTFVRLPDDTFRRSDEHHDNVLIRTADVPAFLASNDVDAEIRNSFGSETLPTGLHVVIGVKR
jgi:SAM-dependent methyltransferase